MGHQRRRWRHLKRRERRSHGLLAMGGLWLAGALCDRIFCWPIEHYLAPVLWTHVVGTIRQLFM